MQDSTSRLLGVAEPSGSGEHGAWTKEDDALPKRVRESLARPRAAGPTLQADSAALYRQRLAPIEPYLKGGTGAPPVNHLIILPAGQMGGVPIEALALAATRQGATLDYTICYAPSATMYTWLREQSKKARHRQGEKRAPTLLALGDPVFVEQAAPSTPEAEPPAEGIFLTMVQPGSNADRYQMLPDSKPFPPLFDPRSVGSSRRKTTSWAESTQIPNPCPHRRGS